MRRLTFLAFVMIIAFRAFAQSYPISTGRENWETRSMDEKWMWLSGVMDSAKEALVQMSYNAIPDITTGEISAKILPDKSLFSPLEVRIIKLIDAYYYDFNNKNATWLEAYQWAIAILRFDHEMVKKP